MFDLKYTIPELREIKERIGYPYGVAFIDEDINTQDLYQPSIYDSEEELENEIKVIPAQTILIAALAKKLNGFGKNRGSLFNSFKNKYYNEEVISRDFKNVSGVINIINEVSSYDRN